MRGSGLITRPALAALRTSFGREVARIFGLKEPPRRMSGSAHGQAVGLVQARLESSQDAILRSGLWSTVRRDIERDPARFMAALGLELPTDKPATKKPARTMVQIFTSTGKGGKIDRNLKPIGFDGLREASPKTTVSPGSLKPIGFENGPEKRTQKHRNLSCVGFGKKRDVSISTNSGDVYRPTEPSRDPTKAAGCIERESAEADSLANPTSPVGHDGIITTRERDGDCTADRWNEELGDFIKAPAQAPRTARPIADTQAGDH